MKRSTTRLRPLVLDYGTQADRLPKSDNLNCLTGGDADTNACVAGAMLGCKLGIEAIPESWKNKLKHKDWLDQQVQKYFTMVNEADLNTQPVTAS